MTPKTWARALAIAIGMAMAVVAWEWRTGAIGGSDSACYALMSRVFAEGAWQPLSPLATEAPWPDATRVAAPAGFLPSMSRAGAAVPVCAPGYSLLVAPLVAVAGLDAVHVVPPLATAALVVLAFVLACRLGTPMAGVAAAVLVATTPIVLFQAVQPMNDITTGALWLAVAVAMSAARPAVTGVLVGVALLVRPNLAIAGAFALAGVAWLRASRVQKARLWTACRFLAIGGVATLPGVLTALWLNRGLYGSPFQSGYGDLGVLFAAAHVPINTAYYGRIWLLSCTPVVLLSLLAWWRVTPERRPAVLVTSGLALALAVVYLAYRPFGEWWYLRFLLPSVALGAVLTAVSLDALATAVLPRRAAVVVATIAAGMAIVTLRSSYAKEAFGLQALEVRFPDTAAVVASRLDEGAVPITIWQSGGLRFWPGRDVVVWDALEPQWLDTAVDWLQIHGRQPAIVVERWEESSFRDRFAGQAFGGLDWPPRYDVDRRVRIFLPEDRERYLRGEPVVTETIFGPRRR